MLEIKRWKDSKLNLIKWVRLKSFRQNPFSQVSDYPGFLAMTQILLLNK